MIEITQSKPFAKTPNETLLREAAHATLSQQNAPQDATLSILLTDDEQIRSLNRDYRGIDAPTDVLSFDVHTRDPESGYLYLGELIISLPYAARQAAQKGHALEAEAQLLVVHGVLHLLGHDHAEAEEKEKMWQAQTTVLHQLGLSEIQI